LDIQQERITRIHDYSIDFEALKTHMTNLSAKYPSGVIIPVKGQDLDSPSLEKTIFELNKCDYLKKLYIALSASEAEYKKATSLCSSFKIPCDIVWCNKPDVIHVLNELKRRGLDITEVEGKGKDLWIALGIASLDLYAIGIHDADITTYNAALPTKLLYSVVEPRLDFFFSKGYYARVNFEQKRIYGRIYRLFINPLLAALQRKFNHTSSFIRYLQSFRYPLSGEMGVWK
jgi:glucosyl-3-phosphoglycerate synthase